VSVVNTTAPSLAWTPGHLGTKYLRAASSAWASMAMRLNSTLQRLPLFKSLSLILYRCQKATGPLDSAPGARRGGRWRTRRADARVRSPSGPVFLPRVCRPVGKWARPTMSGDGWAMVNANSPRASGSAQRDEDWLNLWSARFSINNETLLRRTANAVEGMDSSKMRAHDLSSIGAARMKRLPHKGHHLEEGSAPFDVLHMDVFSVRKHEIVKSADGKPLSFQYALVMIVDGFSRFPWTYFCREKTELPGLLNNLFFNDVGIINRLHAAAAAHFFLQYGRAPHPHLDGDIGSPPQTRSRSCAAPGCKLV